MNKIKRHEIFVRLQQENPNPTTELNYNSNFELLIAVMLSAQATDVSVNLATSNIFPTANTPESILAMGINNFTNAIKSIGLYKTKARYVIQTCKILIDQYQSQVPNNRVSLESLPGVGRKTANVVLNTAFGQPTIAVDTHIFRVSNRTRIASGKNVLEVEKKLLRFIPKQFMLNAHHWLILHGRYTCTARKPRCSSCSIEDLCEYRCKTED